MGEPIPVIPLEYAKPPARAGGRTWDNVIVHATVLAYLCCAVGWVLIVFYDVISVLATGPALFAAGLLMTVAGALRRRPAVLALGAAHCGVCLLFFALVNLLDWDPERAARPFAWMSGTYTLAVAIPTALLLARRGTNQAGAD